MRFKDRLKELRLRKGLTQKELSEAIFVSRSAVAKWENGLGLPSPASYEALLDFFETSESELPLNEQVEEPLIKRRVIIHVASATVSWCLIIALAISPILLIYAVMNGYGFTSRMAAGKYFSDNEVISTADYDFYLGLMDILDESGEVKEREIHSFCVIEKRFYGFQKIETEPHRRYVFNEEAEDASEERIGILYSFAASDCYYNIFRSKITLLGPIESDEEGASVPVKETMLREIYVDGDRIELTYLSFFVTEEKVTEFDAIDYYGNELHLSVKENVEQKVIIDNMTAL